MKNRKIHLPKLLSWQEGTMMSGHCLAQLNTQCDRGTWTVLVLGRAQGSTPGIRCRAKGWAPKLLQLPKSPLQRGVCPRKQGKEFFHSQPFRDVPVNLSLSYSRAEPVVSRQQQENPSKQRFARLGNRLFHTEFCYQEHIFPTMGSPPKQGPFSTRSCRLPLAPNSSISDPPWVLFKASVVQESLLSITKSWDKGKPPTLPREAPEGQKPHLCTWKLLSLGCQQGKSHKPRSTWLLWLLSTVRCSLQHHYSTSFLGNARA